MLHRLILAAALAAGLSSPVSAQQQGAPVQLQDYRGQAAGTDLNPIVTRGPTGGAAMNGSVTPAGTNGSSAQAFQGIQGGIPQNSYPCQYNATLPALASGASGYAACDSNGRLIQAPGAVVNASPAGVTRTRLTCTLPAYATGGNVVCTDASGTQTTTACAANTACLIAAALPGRKTAFFQNRNASGPLDVGYSATVAPGTGIGLADTGGVTNGQGGSLEENPAHVGAYYAAAAAVSTLVFVQGQ